MQVDRADVDHEVVVADVRFLGCAFTETGGAGAPAGAAEAAPEVTFRDCAFACERSAGE